MKRVGASFSRQGLEGTSRRRFFIRESLRPGIWLGLAGAVLLADYFSGPFVSLSVLFVIPVVLAARYSGRIWGCALGVLMPLAHFAFTVVWPAPWSSLESAINLAIRAGALVGFALLVDHITRLEREVRILRGLLPICAFCKRIRTGDQKWQQIELYITEHSEARFTHSFCPECAKEHYPQIFDKLSCAGDASTRSSGPGGAPNGTLGKPACGPASEKE